MRKRHFILLLVFISLLSACKKQEEVQLKPSLLINGDIEQQGAGWYRGCAGAISPTNLFGMDYNPNEYVDQLTTETASSPQHSLMVYCRKVIDINAYFFYSQNYIPTDNIPIGATLTLKAKIKTALQGNGVSMSIRGDKGTRYGIFFPTTERKTQITGTQDFTEYSLVLDSYPGDIDNLQIFLVYLPGTTGTAYFDDISLTVN